MGERSPIRGVTLDTGALIAFERGDARMRLLLREALRTDAKVIIPAGVVAQAWRDGNRQVELGILIRSSSVQIETLTTALAMAVGELCARRRTSDAIAASVVLAARRSGTTVITCDPDDIHHLDPTLRVRSI